MGMVLYRWATGTTGRVMYQEMDKPKPKDPIHQLPAPRLDQRLSFQFRVQHTQLNSDINRFNPLHLPLCRNCSHPYKTVEHVVRVPKITPATTPAFYYFKCALWLLCAISSKYLYFHSILFLIIIC